MRFTITPLGGAKQTIRQAVAGIVDYLIPKDRPTRHADQGSPVQRAGTSRPGRYYADRGDEPGRWLGSAADELGLSGLVDAEDFARVLGGRDPRTGERLITARGSAGRRPRLGVGSETRWDDRGEAIYDVHDAAAALDMDEEQVDKLLQAGTRMAASQLFGWLAGKPGAGTGTVAAQAETTGSEASSGGSYLVPVVDLDGERWVTDAELTRYEDARAIGPSSEGVAADGDPDDELSLAEAAAIAGVTVRYMQGVAKTYEDNRELIDELVASGRQPRRAYLVAHRGPRKRWFVKRRDLADFLDRREPPAVRVGYDLTATTEKSLSVLALLADDAQSTHVLDAIQEANDSAMAWLEDHAAETRVKGETVQTTGWTVASFRHLTSRALDPFVHHHNVIGNTVTASDGTRRALDARGLYRCAQAAGALATAQVRWRITRDLGVRWRRARNGSGWEVGGINDEMVVGFSQRRNEVEDALRELEEAIGRGVRPDEVEQVVLRTRPPKQHAEVDELRAAWWQRAHALGFTPDDLAACVNRPAPEHVPERHQLYARLAAPDGICKHLSVFDYGDLLAALCNMAVPQPDSSDPQPLIVSADELEELAQGFLGSEHVVTLTDDPDLTRCAWATTEILAVQERIVARCRAGLRDPHSAAVDSEDLRNVLLRHPHLTREQRGLVTAFCSSGQRIACGIGRAGAGKTTAMQAAADAWRTAGYRVVGAAVKGEAARILGDATGIPTETLAWWLAHEDPHTIPLDDRAVLVVDEASTVSDRDLDRLSWLAEQTGATLRLLGDPAQHGAVEAGGMFRVLCERFPERTPELTDSLRVQHPHDRAAADALREGHVNEALDLLEAAGHLHIVDDELDFYREVLTRWWHAHLADEDHPMVDRRNAVRHRLNRLAHRLLQAHGEVGTDEITATGHRGFAIGDRVIAREPARHLHVQGDRSAYVRNGATGTVTVTALRPGTSPEDDTITVDFDGIGPITLPRSFFDQHRLTSGELDVGLDHAYAVTSYAVQGSTSSLSTSRIDEHATRAETYVDITRGTDANHLYLTRASNDPLDGEQLPRTPRPPIDTAVANRLRRSKGEETAWEIRERTRQQPDSQKHPALSL